MKIHNPKKSPRILPFPFPLLNLTSTFILLSCIFTLSSQNPTINPDDYSLEYIIQISAPGASTPSSNPLQMKLIDTMGTNQLQQNGALTNGIIGTSYNKKYSKFLGNFFDQKTTKIYSCSLPKCQLSIKYYLQKLFTSKKMESVNYDSINHTLSDIKWHSQASNTPTYQYNNEIFKKALQSQQFYFLDSETFSDDLLFHSDLKSSCPAAPKIMRIHNAQSSFSLRGILSKLRKHLAREKVNTHRVFNHQSWTPTTVRDIFQSMRTFYFETGSFWKGVSQSAYSFMEAYYYAYQYKIYAQNIQIRKIFTHHISEKILDIFGDASGIKSKNDGDRKVGGPIEDGYVQGQRMTLFSGEEKTLISFVGLLRLQNYECLTHSIRSRCKISLIQPFLRLIILIKYIAHKAPKDYCKFRVYPSSRITLELRKKMGKYYVRGLLDQEEIEVCPLSSVDSRMCPLQEFQQFLGSEGMAKDFYKLCKNDEATIIQDESITSSVHSEQGQFFVLCLVYFILTIALLGLLYCRTQSVKDNAEREIVDQYID